MKILDITPYKDKTYNNKQKFCNTFQNMKFSPHIKQPHISSKITVLLESLKKGEINQNILRLCKPLPAPENQT